MAGARRAAVGARRRHSAPGPPRANRGSPPGPGVGRLPLPSAGSLRKRPRRAAEPQPGASRPYPTPHRFVRPGGRRRPQPRRRRHSPALPSAHSTGAALRPASPRAGLGWARREHRRRTRPPGGPAGSSPHGAAVPAPTARSPDGTSFKRQRRQRAGRGGESVPAGSAFFPVAPEAVPRRAAGGSRP